MSTRTRRTRRTHRTRVFAAAALTAAALTLTACSDGQGVQDEGSSTGSASTSESTTSPKANGGNSSGAGQTDQVGSTSGGSTGGTAGSSGTSGSNGASGSTGSSGSKGATGSTGSKDSGPTRTPCSSSSTRVTATEVSRPLNHLLLTVTNTGSKNCNLNGYPAVRFGEAQSVPPVVEDSKPQAVVTLAPGESGYAGVLLSVGDGNGSNGYTAKSLEVYFNDGAGAATPSLPAKGVYVDDSIRVTYFQSTMANALAW
ncbi:DUF4232 domain-containing protein [Streptomyces spongiae]|uniref:DUF4232 domain-containing protein n=1 Tax=Streptomyces spongiae TaxID=565072 RepID=A0A5N8XRV7_9ACTN|nr:DUF4232 domain-containing protein [Streptomyces spongiae]MPY62084.1 DUF4232 domain-containing protein [Streptomyces spongiae]